MTIISDVTHTGESDTTTVRDIATLPQHPSWCDGADEWEAANVPGDTDDRFHHFRTAWFQAFRVDSRDPVTGQINPGPAEIECTVGSLGVEDVESAISQLAEIKRRLDQDRA